MTRPTAVPIVFAQQTLTHILGEVVSDAGLKQLRIAETEKYPHVTYFFNGGVEKQYPGEDREIIPSPKDVPTYDFKPRDERAGGDAEGGRVAAELRPGDPEFRQPGHGRPYRRGRRPGSRRSRRSTTRCARWSSGR